MSTWWTRRTISLESILFLVLALLVAGVLLLWATAGRAEEPEYDRTLQVCTEKYHYISCINIDEKVVTGDCLNKMEAAMRAMEPYRAFPIPSRHPKEAEKQYFIMGHLTEGLRLAVTQWDAVKKECWKQP